jgi:hypothetical protein
MDNANSSGCDEQPIGESVDTHSHVRGSPGSGKTSRLSRLIEQIRTSDRSIHIIDLKGDSAELLLALRKE